MHREKEAGLAAEAYIKGSLRELARAAEILSPHPRYERQRADLLKVIYRVRTIVDKVMPET